MVVTMRRSGRITASVGYSHHDHVCRVYRGEPSWWASVRSFLLEGAARRDRVVLVTPRPAEASDDLAGMPSLERLLARGQLLVVDSGAWRDAVSEPRPWEATVEAWVGEAMATGRRGVRIAVDATGLVEERSFGRPQESELLLDRLVCDLPLTVMCGYDGERLDPQVGVSLCFAHPLWNGAKGEVEANLFAESGGRWRIVGSLDLMTREDLRIGLSATSAGSGDVVLELSELEFIDVGAVRDLVRLAQSLSPERSLVLRDPPRGLRDILRLGWGADHGVWMVSR
jgi:anti-anti-sigma regulatory factor